MKNLVYVVAVLALMAVGAVAGILIYNAALAGDGEASEEISAPTLDPNVTPTPGYSQVVATNEALQTQIAVLQQITPEPVVTEEITAETPPEETDTAETNSDGLSGRSLFRIEQTESEVRFNIDETLNGNRITVVGTTDQVAGDIVVDFDNPGSSQVGTIRINVRTLTTDNRFRNDALRARILRSAEDEFEFAEFTPTDLANLPESVSVGDTIEFQITGDLTVRGTTNSVTFDTTVTVVSADRLEGYATATILYRDFGLVIPNVPSVSDVADEVILEIEFVALRVNE
ncbi:MAG: YceI family protein [Phototrophicales bacterium]|nr:MAG: YceI family protein [Phototrophicales bacterium]RMG74507.1 MAG: YceI family protein [Chloroflexota bacterium]